MREATRPHRHGRRALPGVPEREPLARRRHLLQHRHPDSDVPREGCQLCHAPGITPTQNCSPAIMDRIDSARVRCGDAYGERRANGVTISGVSFDVACSSCHAELELAPLHTTATCTTCHGALVPALATASVIADSFSGSNQGTGVTINANYPALAQTFTAIDGTTGLGDRVLAVPWILPGHPRSRGLRGDRHLRLRRVTSGESPRGVGAADPIEHGRRVRPLHVHFQQHRLPDRRRALRDRAQVNGCPRRLRTVVGHRMGLSIPREPRCVLRPRRTTGTATTLEAQTSSSPSTRHPPTAGPRAVRRRTATQAHRRCRCTRTSTRATRCCRRTSRPAFPQAVTTPRQLRSSRAIALLTSTSARQRRWAGRPGRVVRSATPAASRPWPTVQPLAATPIAPSRTAILPKLTLQTAPVYSSVTSRRRA